MDQKICVHTYKNRGKLSEYIIIDLDNKTVKKTFLAGKWLTPVIGEFNTSYFIKNSKIYYIIENLDEDEWEIHSTDIFQSAESAYKITFLETAQ